MAYLECVSCRFLNPPKGQKTPHGRISGAKVAQKNSGSLPTNNGERKNPERFEKTLARMVGIEPMPYAELVG